MPKKKEKIEIDYVKVVIESEATVNLEDGITRVVFRMELPAVSLPGGADKTVRKEIETWLRLKKSKFITVLSGD